jgi:alpha-beta hydrolase superfamily lysophospholipase
MPYFDGRRGRIFHDVWLPAGQPTGAVVLLHGFGEHLGLYDAFAQRLVADGVAVHALDFAGFGRSDGPRAIVESWDDLVADALQLVEVARRRNPGVPLTVVGHSGGATTAMLLALRSPQSVDAVVLSGGPLRPLGWVAEELASGRDETEGGEPPEFLSTHPDYVHALLHDPLTWKGGFTRSMLLALEKTWPEIEAGVAADRPQLPTLFVHGTADPIAPVADAEELAGRLSRARITVFEGDLHDVLNEHDRDAVHEVVAEFVRSVQPVAV